MQHMTQQLILDLLPPSPPSLANFVAGQNEAVIQALRDCGPGRAVYLWGAPGAGRTHLLQSMAGLPASLYVDHQTPASHLRTIASEDQQTYRLIAIDNIECFDENQQSALFALYNRWRELATAPQGFALVLAGDRAPIAMPVREDLRTRLGWDLVFRLEQLSDEDRAQALANRSAERGLQLAPEVINWVLTHYTRDMRHLSALIDALDRYSLERHRAITLPLLKELLASGQADNDKS